MTIFKCSQIILLKNMLTFQSLLLELVKLCGQFVESPEIYLGSFVSVYVTKNSSDEFFMKDLMSVY